MKPQMVFLSALVLCGLAHGQTYRRWQESNGKKWQTDVVVPVFPLSGALESRANADVDAWAKGVKAEFKKDYRNAGPLPPGAPQTTWTLDINPLKETVYRRGRVLSFAMQNYTFTGGAHGMTNTITFNYLKNGAGQARQVALRDLFAGSDWERQLSTLVIQKLLQRDGAMWVENGQIRDFKESDLRMFTLGANAITFYFDPYAVGPYSSGSFEVEVPYAELGPDFRAGLLR